MQRFQVYKKIRTGGLMHITSIEASTRLDAINLFEKECWQSNVGKYYYITGLTIPLDENLMSSFYTRLSNRNKNDN